MKGHRAKCESRPRPSLVTGTPAVMRPSMTVPVLEFPGVQEIQLLPDIAPAGRRADQRLRRS
jgi:hypothetical protein